MYSSIYAVPYRELVMPLINVVAHSSICTDMSAADSGTQLCVDCLGIKVLAKAKDETGSEWTLSVENAGKGGPFMAERLAVVLNEKEVQGNKKQAIHHCKEEILLWLLTLCRNCAWGKAPRVEPDP